jgi:transcriptional regulator with XRE-family HTH domain
MHTPETRQKFIERRAQGWSLVRLATELGVARSTLIEWSRQLRFEIQNQRAIELDDLRKRLLGTCQSRAAVLAEKLSRIEDELRKRDLATVPTRSLFDLSLALRRELDKNLGDASFAVPIKDIPNAEYIEQVQEWKP